MKWKILLSSILLFMNRALAHTGENTPGIKLHHISTGFWALISLILIAAVTIIYAKTHNKSLNPFKWL